MGSKPGERIVTSVAPDFRYRRCMMRVIDEWFKGVKDLLDDGKVNGSQEKEE